MVKRASWLSVTPEPERELPGAVATLALGHRAPPEAVARERDRVERLILRRTQAQWLAYLHSVVELIDRPEVNHEPDVARARAVAMKVVLNHHNLLLALPGRAAEVTAVDRLRLERLREPNPEAKGRR
jgi:hypothetical protein